MPTRQNPTRCWVASVLTLAVLVPVSLLAAREAGADWRSDEAHIKKLQRRVAELKQAVSLFERHRRALELVEAEIANVQLGLANPQGEPRVLVRKLLASSFPEIKIKMTKLAAKEPAGINVWRWRCQLSGALGEIRWATQLLRQKGLFILPSPGEPVELSIHADQRSASLYFTGHHIRLKHLGSDSVRELRGGKDLYAARTDPLAHKIRRLRAEVAELRGKVVDIQGFEARINAIRKYLGLLKSLTRRAQDPFRAITPLLDLELLHFESIVHGGRVVSIRGWVVSESALGAVERWLKRLGDRKVQFRLQTKRLIYRAASTQDLPLPKLDVGGGGRFRVIAAAARPVDLGLAASRSGAVVAVAGERASISGRTKPAPLYTSLGAPALALGLALIRDGANVLLVPREVNSATLDALKKSKQRRGGRRKSLQHSAAYGEALALVRGFFDALEAPRSAIDSKRPTLLAGRAPAKTWLRLVGAAAGLQLVDDRSTPRLTRVEDAKTKTFQVPDPKPPARQPDRRGRLRHPLSVVRPRLLVLSGARSFAVVSSGDGMPRMIRRGAFLGKNHSQVVKIDERGLTLLWSGAGVTRRLLLPIGESQISRRSGSK